MKSLRRDVARGENKNAPRRRCTVLFRLTNIGQVVRRMASVAAQHSGEIRCGDGASVLGAAGGR